MYVFALRGLLRHSQGKRGLLQPAWRCHLGPKEASGVPEKRLIPSPKDACDISSSLGWVVEQAELEVRRLGLYPKLSNTLGRLFSLSVSWFLHLLNEF